ncbi:hypothetical protein [Niallia taxi]|uniref:Uncharacterized protein n=1 Tax=Niallia taxi TaxID=2499688 RepID=A0A3S2UTB3_9BACI|nr:hypothetical protein [Niallia taxi]RVT56437.1 hypothetical protein EM808_27500 [Niallia taxi]
MLVKFCREDGGDEIHVQHTEDIAGLIEASKGGKLIFGHDFYEYDNHILNTWTDDDGKLNQEVIIYLADYGTDLSRFVKVEAVIQETIETKFVTLETANLMLNADIVTIGDVSVDVRESEVTSKGIVKFHGNKVEI